MSGQLQSSHYTHEPRRNRICEKRVDDPYQARGKLKEPTACPDCGAVFHAGRWQWNGASPEAGKQRCPACSRIHDHVAAGILTLSGKFLHEHKDELLRLVQVTEEKEKSGHPLERIMNVEEGGDQQQVQISFTGIHLTKRTGEALRNAYHGNLHFSYTERNDVIHAAWER